MVDSTKIALKETFWAADMAGNAHSQYDFSPNSNQKPSDLLATVCDTLITNNNKIGVENLVKRLPERMTALNFDNSKGIAQFQSVKTADYFIPSGGAGSSTITGTGIIPILVADTIMEGAMPLVCAREAVWTIRMKSSVQTVPFFTARSYIDKQTAGADALDLMQRVAHATLRAYKYSVSAGIGKELVNDAQMDIIAAALKEMGGTMEATINRLVFSTMLENAYATPDIITTNSANATIALFDSQGTVDGNGYLADTAVVWPAFWAAIMGSFVPAYNPLAQEKAEKKPGVDVVHYGGLDIYRVGIALDAGITAKAVNYPTASGYGGMVFDKSRAGALGLREDMVNEEFDDVMKYMTRPVLTSRFDFVPAVDENTSTVNNKNSIVLISHS